VVITRGKKPSDMKNPEDFYDVIDIVAGGPLTQAPDAFGCKLGSYT
jgi:branched-chain amino acid transport system substrate-binding protein